jgi:molybdopterin synthase sulfur carrier subunit
MQVECAFFGPLRDAVGEKTIVRDTHAATVGELLARLEDDHPGLEGRLLQSEDALGDGLAITIDGKHVQHLDGYDTELSDGDTVRMTPAVYGG